MVRAAAVGALARIGVLEPDELLEALADPSAVVRLRAITETVHLEEPDVDGPDKRRLLSALLTQIDSAETAEAALWALGEQAGTDTLVVERLMSVATAHADPLCREAAVAALGSIGDPRSLPAVLTATYDKATVRRRAVIALAAFEGDEVDDRLQEALTDRDWQVSQAAEDLLLVPPGPEERGEP
jgi:HEAT repeat protein